MSKVLRGLSVAKRPLPPRVESSPPAPSAAGASKAPNATAAQPSPPPDPDFVRSPGNIVWYLGNDTRGPASTPRVEATVQVTAADSTGIAVVRHVFDHVAREPQ